MLPSAFLGCRVNSLNDRGDKLLKADVLSRLRAARTAYSYHAGRFVSPLKRESALFKLTESIFRLHAYLTQSSQRFISFSTTDLKK